MTSYRTGNRLIAGFIALAGLLFLLTPVSHAQAQENIANMNTQGSTVDNGATAQLPGDAGMAPAADDNQDPPTRVARLSFIDGSVSMQPGGAGDWGAAAGNRPVTIGDKLWTDQNSRAELQAGQASIHLGSMTALSFLNLNDNIIQMRMAEGHLNFRVRELRQGDTYEVDAPNLAFTVTEAGAFRIDVNENGDYTSVTVIRGKGEIAAAGQTYPLEAGQRGDISGTDQNVKFVPGSASEPDPLDRWAQERDLKEEQSPSARYVNRDTVGYSDLDDYGTWKQEPDAGNVWVPNNVPPDWAPYSNGYWSYVGPWGWTWVDYAPWGFAPYHYGRWGYYGGYWGWSPGPIWAPAVYGPAFVGFLGGGFGFGFGFGLGFGWFPLGWGEPFHPWYHSGPGYWNHINVYNTHFNNFNSFNAAGMRNFNYRYAHDTRAVTATSRSNFVSGGAVNRGAAHLTEASLRGTAVAGGPNAHPTNASYMGASNMHGRVATPSASVQNRSVVTRSTPAAAASHLPAHTMNSSSFSANRGATTGAQNFSSARQSQLSASRPPSANTSRPSGATRTWSAQGNSTDSGRAPQGFGSENRPATTQTARMNSNDRPPWARSGSNSSGSRPATSYNGGNRSYSAPSYNRSSGSYGGSANRSYSAPRGYNAPSNRGYSAPRSYSAPHSSSAPRSYSAPHSSGGSHSSGGGFHGGGGGSHGGHH